MDPKSAPLSLLENVTSSLSNWFLFNGLQLNADKSEILLVGTQEKRRALNPLFASGLTIAGSPVSLSSSTRILGITFDSALSFDAHISEVCISANYHLRAFAHIRSYLSLSSANLVASSIVSSRLDYCNSLLNGLSAHNIQRLQCVQNRAARIVLGVGHRVSAEPLLRKLHWLPVAKRIQYKTALVTFKVLSTHQPPYLSSLLVPYNPSRTLRSSTSNFLTVPRVKTAFQTRAFSVAAPHLWNSLPAALRSLIDFNPSSLPVSQSSPSYLVPSVSLDVPSIPNLPSFKRLLKAHLFDSPLLLAT